MTATELDEAPDQADAAPDGERCDRCGAPAEVTTVNAGGRLAVYCHPCADLNRQTRARSIMSDAEVATMVNNLPPGAYAALLTMRATADGVARIGSRTGAGVIAAATLPTLADRGLAGRITPRHVRPGLAQLTDLALRYPLPTR